MWLFCSFCCDDSAGIKISLKYVTQKLNCVKYKISLCSCENKDLIFLTEIFVFVFGTTSLFLKYFGLCKHFAIL